MSFFQDLRNDFFRPEPHTADNVRTQGKTFLFIGIGFFLWFIIQIFIYSGDTIVFENVRAHIELTDPALVQTAVGKYGYSSNHVLIYEPVSILDRLVFSKIEGLSLPDFVFFLYVGIVLFIGLRKVEEHNVFRLQVSKTYKKVAIGCMWVAVLKMVYQSFVVRPFFNYRTNNEFVLLESRGFFFIFLYFAIGGIILSCVYFISKGESLHNELEGKM